MKTAYFKSCAFVSHIIKTDINKNVEGLMERCHMIAATGGL